MYHPHRRATTHTPLLTLQAHTQPVTAVIWSTEDEVLSAGMDHCIRLWDVPSGVNKSTLVTVSQRHIIVHVYRFVCDTFFHSLGLKYVFHCIHRSDINNLVASANADKVVRIWDTRIGGRFNCKTSLLSKPIS